MTTKKELLYRIESLEEKLNKIERDHNLQMIALLKRVEDFNHLDNKQSAICHEIYKLTKHHEIANTERAGEVTLDDLAKLIIDGTPIVVTKNVKEEITPMCQEVHKSHKS